MALLPGWSIPDPGFGTPIELLCGGTSGLLSSTGIEETLPSKRVAPEELLPIPCRLSQHAPVEIKT